jgi:hypothetical protein
MKEQLFRTRAWGNLVLPALMGAASQSHAQDAKAEDNTYASITPIDQYLISPQPINEFSISVSKWSDGTAAAKDAH